MHAGLQSYVIPFPSPSRMARDFLKQRGARAELVHIDAAHEYDDVKEDIRLWWEIVKDGGVMLGDDFQSGWSGVVRAACEHAERIGVPIERFHPGSWGLSKKWWLRKPHVGAAPKKALGSAWLAKCMKAQVGMPVPPVVAPASNPTQMDA